MKGSCVFKYERFVERVHTLVSKCLYFLIQIKKKKIPEIFNRVNIKNTSE